MTYKTHIFADALNDWIYGNVAITIVSPGTIGTSSLAVALFTGTVPDETGTVYTEVTNANAYARIGIVRGTDFTASSALGTIKNDGTAITFPKATPAGWGNITAVGIFHHATNAVTYGAGDLWAYTTVGGATGSVTVNAGDTPVIAIDSLTIIEK